SAKADADAGIVSSEATAWNSYVGTLDVLRSNLQSTEAAAATVFDSRVNSAVSRWLSRETTGWTRYATATENLPGSPPLGQRILTPRPVQVCSTNPFAGLTASAREPVGLPSADRMKLSDKFKFSTRTVPIGPPVTVIRPV